MPDYRQSESQNNSLRNTPRMTPGVISPSGTILSPSASMLSPSNMGNGNGPQIDFSTANFNFEGVLSQAESNRLKIVRD